MITYTNPERVRRAVEAALREYKANHLDGHEVSELDYIAGAMAALQAVFGIGDKLTRVVPAAWIVKPLQGQSILDEDDNNGHEATGRIDIQ